MIAYWWHTRSWQLRATGRIYFICYMFSACMVSQASVARAEGSPVNQMTGWTGIHTAWGIPASSLHLLTPSDHRGGDGFFDTIRAVWQVFKDLVALQFPAGLLTFMVGMFLMFMALILWLYKFAMSMGWLAWMAALFAPLFTVVVQVVNRLGLIPAGLMAGVVVGAIVVLAGERGRGTAMIVAAFAIGLFGLVLFANPMDDLYSETGMLAQIRHLGFQLGEVIHGNGVLSGNTGTAQLDSAMTGLATNLMQDPNMLINFGHVLGPQCQGPYAEALNTADSTKALDLIKGCDVAAFNYASNLSWQSLGSVIVFCFLMTVIGLFVIYVVVAQVGVAFKGGAYALAAIPTLGPGMIPGPTQRFWLTLVKNFGLHFLEWLLYTVFVSVVGLFIMSAVGDDFAARTGVNHPVVKFLVAAMMSTAAIWAFYKITQSFKTMPYRKMRAALNGAATPAQAAMLGAFHKGQSAADWAKNWLNAPSESRESGGDDDDDEDGKDGKAHEPDVPTLPDNVPTPTVQTTPAAESGESGSGGESAAGKGKVATEAAIAAAAPEVAAAQRVSQRLHGGSEARDTTGAGASVSASHSAGEADFGDWTDESSDIESRGRHAAGSDEAPAVPALPVDAPSGGSNGEPSAVRTLPEEEGR